MSFMRKLSELKENPLSLAIYGAEEDAGDLVESIKTLGVLTPLLVKEDGTIISGHRRCRAAKKAGLEAVPCELAEFAGPEEEEIVVISANKNRQKSVTQLLREAERMKEALAEQAKKRQLSKLNHSAVTEDALNPLVVPNLGTTRGAGRHIPQRVRSCVVIADALGLSKSSWLRLDSVSRAAKAGNPTAVEALLQLDRGKITINKALSMVKKSMTVKDENTGTDKEIAFSAECLKNAKAHLKALTDILREVEQSDEEFGATVWLLFCGDIERLPAATAGVRKKMERIRQECLEASAKARQQEPAA